MSYYNTCSYCGAHLDPGESCDCEEDLKDEADKDDMEERRKAAGEYEFIFGEGVRV